MAGQKGSTLLLHVLLSTIASKKGANQRVVKLVQKVMSWNIHGPSHRGMAAARNLLVPRMIRKINPDIVLLQETKTDKLVNRIVETVQPTRQYEKVCAGDRRESRILYDANLYTSIPLDTSQLRDVVDSAVAMENQTSETYKDCTSIVGLEHEVVKGKSKGSGVVPIRNILIFMSFHNTHRGTRKDTASTFCKLVVELGDTMGRVVVAGADLNCSKDKFESHGAVIPAYVTSKRRRHKPTIDYFVLSGRVTRMDVSVRDWVDAYDDNDSDLHKTVRGTVREDRYSLGDYCRALDHDPIVCELTVTVQIYDS